MNFILFQLKNYNFMIKEFYLQPKEVHIEVPWGHIAGKWYGPENVRPILMVHGWQDSAGSFDTLIPLLPPDLSYLAIDLPGHGFSSHLPKGCNYHSVDFVQLLEKIRLNYKWDQLSLVAHSMGAIVSFVYASVYPERTNLVCALDTLKIQCHDPKLTHKICVWQMKKLNALNDQLMQKPPEYAYDDLPQRVYEGSMKSVNLDKAKYMIERGTKPSLNDPNKFCFTRDIRVKFMQKFFVDQQIGLEYVKQIKAPYLFFRGDDHDFAEPDKNLYEAVDLFKQCNEHFELVRVRGTHHFHLNEPELVGEKLSEFLLKYHAQEGILMKQKI